MSNVYYKTSAPEVLAALAAYSTEAQRVRALGQVFAAKFGGTLLSRHDAHGYEVGGLRFEPRNTSPLWTVPDAKNAGAQRPRASLAKAEPDQREELKQLLADWIANFPKDRADYASVLEAIGTDWGNLLFCGISAFEVDGAFYVATSAKLNDRMVEILGSEFDAARQKHKAAP